MRILIAGLTTRALAESAVRAGADVVTVDHFGDLDQKRLCENVSLREREIPYGPAAFVEVARGLAYDALVYCGGLENAPGAVAALAAGRRLLGNDPDTLRRVRDPAVLLPFLEERGWRTPRTILGAERSPGGALPRTGGRRAAGRPRPAGRAWLRKPARGGGGVGVRAWRGGPLEPHEMLQERIAGVCASAMFAADGRRSTVLAWSEQLRARGRFLYGGNLMPLEAPAAAWNEVGAIAAAVTREFGLRGLNGLDFVLSGGRPVTLEVNPRYSASMELLERSAGVSVFRLHADACEGVLPAAPVPTRGAWGKAIVYARATVRVGDTSGWIDRGVRDVPHPGERIERGHPICTVFASGPARAECRARLREERAAIWRECSAPGAAAAVARPYVTGRPRI